MASNLPDTRIVPWVRSPRQIDFFSDWSPAEVKLWTALNSATQINTRNGRISVPTLARFTGYSERSIYRILRRLKDRGAVYSLVSPGHTAVYYLPYQYSAQRSTPISTYTPDNRVTPHNNKVRIDNNRPRTRRYSPYRPAPVSPLLTATCYQSYTEYCATTNCPVSLDTWISS
jgi:hypothetical protein